MTRGNRQIGATVPADLDDAVRESAQRNERSFSAEVRLALRHWVGRDSNASDDPAPLATADLES